jgi:hypothetical protein
MGLETQAVISGHLTVHDICRRLRTGYGAVAPLPRGARVADHWMIEFTDRDGQHRLVDAFLNSWAADDYHDLDVTESTLLSMELGPTSEAVMRALVKGSKGWTRRHSGQAWEALL